MALTVTVLGCDGSYPGPGGAGSGYLVRGGGAVVWLDAGPGSLAALQTHVGLDQLDAVVVSHEHPDHRSDLEGFAVASEYVLRRRDPVPVYAPAGVREHGYHTDVDALAFTDLVDGSAFEVGGLRFACSRTDHGPETLAVRVEVDGRALGFSADTGPAWHPSALGPLDAYLCEATYTSDREVDGGGGHLSGRQAGALAREAGVGALWLTHLWAITDRDALWAEAEAAFGAPVELVERHRSYAV